MASMEVKLDRADRIYAPGVRFVSLSHPSFPNDLYCLGFKEKVTGVVKVHTTSSMKHQGVCA